MDNDLMAQVETVLEQEGDDSSPTKMIKILCKLFKFEVDEATAIYKDWRKKRMQDPISTWASKAKMMGNTGLRKEDSEERISKINKEDLYYYYIKRRQSINAIAKMYGVSFKVIKSRLKAYEIPVRKYTSGNTSEIVIPEDVLKKLYIDEDHTGNDIARMYNCSGNCIRMKLEKLGLKKLKEKMNGINAKEGEIEIVTISQSL